MSNEHATILEVQGMTCPSCVRHVSAALTGLEGVGRVDVKLRDGLVVVSHDAARAPVTLLIEALSGAGYASRPRQV
jgi:copper chaperone